MSEDQDHGNDELIECAGPDGVLPGMTEEEFMSFAKKGYSYVMNDLDPKLKLKKGMIIDLAGEQFKLNANPNEVLEVFDAVSKEDLQAAIISACAKIGVTLTYISLFEQGVLQKVDDDGKPLSKNKAEKDVKKEMKIVESTAIFVKSLIERHENELQLEEKRDTNETSGV